MSLSKLTKYFACHEKWISWLILVTHEMLFTMRGVTTVIVQTHQILRLPRKMNLMIDPCHTWNAIYNARSNKCHCPNSPNTAPATKNESDDWSLSHMKRYLQCAEQQVSLCKLTKYCACHAKWSSKSSKKFVQNRWNVSSNAGPIRAGSDHDPTMIRAWSEHETVTPQPASQPRLLFTPTTSILYWKIQHFALRLSFQISPNILPRKVTVQHHQILRLPRKVTVMTDPRHIWHVTYNARNNQCHPPTSPNTAPATQNDCHNWSSSRETLFPMRGTTGVILEHQRIYCACHAKWLSNISKKFLENSWNVISNAGPIREWSEHDPSNIRAGNRPPQPASQQRWLFALATRIFYWKIQHFALRLSFQISPNTAPATKSNSSTSPNTAPATQSNCHDWSSSHMTCHLQCAEQPVSSSNITEYCACHAKWLWWLILVYETLFTMRGTTGGILQHHQILRLPRKMILQNFRNISPKQMKRQLQCATDPSWIRAWSEHDPRMKPSLRNPPRNRGYFSRPPQALYWKMQHFALRLSFQISPNTAPATKSDTSTSPNTAPATKSDTWTSPNNAPATKSDTWTSSNSAPATKSDTWTSQNSDTNLISYESLLKRI